jgi:glycosyltransferase involved in cell wall biosynthesis
MKMDQPLVSVCMITYNHEDYIAEAIEGVLMQKTHFPFELIIGEDESSDGTRNICTDYVNRYPDKIRLFLRSRKKVLVINGRPTGRFNFVENIKAAKGKYIAICPGDDYWTDPGKLQAQVDVLEQNPDCVACYHWQRNTVRDKNGKFTEQEAPRRGEDGYVSELKSDVGRIFSFQLRPQSRTLLFRNVFAERDFPDWFFKTQYGDISLCFLLGKYGKFYFIDKEMAVYRVHNSGVSSIFKNTRGYVFGNREWIRLLVYALGHYDYSYQQEALQGIKVFVERIRKATGDSWLERFRLRRFMKKELDAPRPFKKEMIALLNNQTR